MIRQEEFWEMLHTLVLTSKIVIERPKGTLHPRYNDMRYPFDYGYLDNTSTGDGEGIDIWIGSLNTLNISGVVCTVDTDKRDVELKILLGCTVDDMDEILKIHNQETQSAILFKPEIIPDGDCKFNISCQSERE